MRQASGRDRHSAVKKKTTKKFLKTLGYNPKSAKLNVKTARSFLEKLGYNVSSAKANIGQTKAVRKQIKSKKKK
jgi:hypothetical protein